jgi:hypothetical protein
LIQFNFSVNEHCSKQYKYSATFWHGDGRAQPRSRRGQNPFSARLFYDDSTEPAGRKRKQGRA